jgi:hypothetical protein
LLFNGCFVVGLLLFAMLFVCCMSQLLAALSVPCTWNCIVPLHVSCGGFAPVVFVCDMYIQAANSVAVVVAVGNKCRYHHAEMKG